MWYSKIFPLAHHQKQSEIHLQLRYGIIISFCLPIKWKSKIHDNAFTLVTVCSYGWSQHNILCLFFMLQMTIPYVYFNVFIFLCNHVKLHYTSTSTQLVVRVKMSGHDLDNQYTSYAFFKLLPTQFKLIFHSS